MRIQLLLLLPLLLYGCSLKEIKHRKEREKAKIDSIYKVKVRLAKIDSISRVEGNKAIGCINFGISEKQFKISLDDFLKTMKIASNQNDAYIGQLCIKKENVMTYFNDDSLYFISFKERITYITDFTTGRDIKQKIQSLLKIFSSKYFPIDCEELFYSDIYELPFENPIRAEWKLGRKTIEIRYSKPFIYKSSEQPVVEISLSIMDEDASERIDRKFFIKDFEKETAYNDSIIKIHIKENMDYL